MTVYALGDLAHMNSWKKPLFSQKNHIKEPAAPTFVKLRTLCLVAHFDDYFCKCESSLGTTFLQNLSFLLLHVLGGKWGILQ